MGHEIAEAIIENGQIKYINKKLPWGKVKVHIIYDSLEEKTAEVDIEKIVRESMGIYRDIDVESEAKKLRMSWERDVQN
jgi:hypothetical protein